MSSTACRCLFRAKGSELVGLGACWSIRLGAPSLGSRLGWSRLHRLVRPLLLPVRKSSSQGLETGKGEMPGLEGEIRLPRLQGDSCAHKFRKVDQTPADLGDDVFTCGGAAFHTVW